MRKSAMFWAYRVDVGMYGNNGNIEQMRDMPEAQSEVFRRQALSRLYKAQLGMYFWTFWSQEIF